VGICTCSPLLEGKTKFQALCFYEIRGDKFMDYQEIKELAGELGCKVTDLIALAPQNDPFYAGTKTDWVNANWFTDLWIRFGYAQGVHIRRVHYQIISQSPQVLMPNGKPYENTEGCWDFLNQASKMARYLGLVEPGAFVDRRNPEPKLYAGEVADDPSLWVDNNLWGGAPQLPDFPSVPRYSLSSYTGYQRYHLEIWCEKSTMNDVLIPLCEKYRVNLVTGVGEMSITATLELAKRFNNRPVRIFYVSDFDPAGQSMPVAVSRKVEYFQRSKGFVADVRLYPVVLNLDQVAQYRLPRTPIKESERRAAGFEERYGSGAVELDALEALYPGTLSRILRSHIERYFDRNLSQRVEEERAKLNAFLEREAAQVLEPYIDELETLQSEYERIRAEFEDRLSGLGRHIENLWEAMTDMLGRCEPDISDFEVPEACVADELPAPLYDAQRNYTQQMIVYKEFQGK
jgi:hypothetical protein